MEKNDLEKKIVEEEDFIYAPKFGNSLNKFLAKNDSPLEDRAIGRLLMILPEDVEKIYQESIAILKEDMDQDESN